jgi:polysaccharide biosynthesis transport protein
VAEINSEPVVRQPGLGDYLRILRRRKAVVIMTALLATVLTMVFSLREHKVYQASTTVLLNRQDLASSVIGTPQDPTLSEDPARYAENEALYARSSAVAQLAVNDAGRAGRTPGGLLAESSVNPNPNADSLVFTVNDPDPLAAAGLANAYASAYVAAKLDLETASIKTARRQLEAQMASLRAQKQAGTPNYRALAANEQHLHTMQLLQSRDSVLNRPVSGHQVKPTPKRDATLGLGFGLLLGVALAFGLDALDKRMRSEDEVEHVLGLPLLARLPSPAPGPAGRRRLSMIDDPAGSHAEGIRRLATSIAFASPDQRPQVLMVVSAVPREGKSTTVANLAVALALAGNRVVVVDLDLRQPSIASFFAIHQLTGFTEVTTRQATLAETLAWFQIPTTDPEPESVGNEGPTRSLEVLPSGSLPASPGEFISSEALASRVLTPLRKRFDYVLIDSPPMGVVGDASALCARVDAVVVVARVGVVDRPALRDLKRQLAASPAPALGFVVTGIEAPQSYYYNGAAPAGSGPDERSTNGGNGSVTRDRLART